MSPPTIRSWPGRTGERRPAEVTHAAPRDCPVCGQPLVLTRLGCQSCGTELSGVFEPCQFCALGRDERAMLRVFLSSRGNMKELERHLGVSYPTARARFDGLLDRLGLAPPAGPATPAGPAGVARLGILEALAGGQLDVDEAESLLTRSPDGS
jgi:hypothetical protein